MVLFYVLIVCTVTLPPGVNPIAVDKYIYLYLYLNGRRWKTEIVGTKSRVLIFIRILVINVT